MPLNNSRSSGGWASRAALGNLTNAVAQSITRRNRRVKRRRCRFAENAEPEHSGAQEEFEEETYWGPDSCGGHGHDHECGGHGHEDSDGGDQPSRDSSVGLRLSLCERLNAGEHRLVYVSSDRREGHYIVAARTHQTYHSSPRDFVFVGFRYLLCQAGGKVLVGWCGAERDCPEPPSRRSLFPGHDCLDMSPDELQEGSCICPIAAKLLQQLGGPRWLTHILAMQTGEASQQPEFGESLIGEWELQGRPYTYVNPQDGGQNLFRQWGVVRSLHEGYSCQVCEGRPRHCRHTQVIVGAGDKERALHMPRKEFDRKIKRVLNPISGKLRVKSISQEKLPFFPEEDDVVKSQIRGESAHVLARAK